MMPPVPPSTEKSRARAAHLRRRVLMGFLATTFAFAGPRVASANFAPPPAIPDASPAQPVAGTGPATVQQAAPAVTDQPAIAAPGAAPAATDKSAPANDKAAPVATPAPTSAPAPARPAAVPEVDEEESLRAFADENPTPRTRLNVAAWIGTGVTVALLGVAAFYGAKAGEKASDVDRLTRNFDPTTDLPVEYATVADQYTAAMLDSLEVTKQGEAGAPGAKGTLGGLGWPG